MPDSDLAAQANVFAADVTELLIGTLPNAPSAQAEASGDRVVVKPAGRIRLFIQATEMGWLDVRIRCRLDSSGKWLTVEASSYKLTSTVDRTPVFRVEYLRDAVTCPSGHLHVHAERGALSHLLSQAGRNHPHDMAALHLPLGGARFRPAMEDMVQFLIVECGFDALDGWHDAVVAGRERWCRNQARTVARDFPQEAAESLVALGYEINPPADGHPLTDPIAFHW